MATTPQRALIVIDLQNDYFPDGKFPLWNTEVGTRPGGVGHCPGPGARCAGHSGAAHRGCPAKARRRFSMPERAASTCTPAILAAAPNAVVVTKAQADSFLNTTLEQDAGRAWYRGIADLRHDDPELRHPYRHFQSGREIPGCGARRLLCLGEPDDPCDRLEGTGRTRAGRGIGKRPVAAAARTAQNARKIKASFTIFPSSLYDWRFRKIAGFKEFSWPSTVTAVLPWSAAAFPSLPSACSRAMARPCSRPCTLPSAISVTARPWAPKRIQAFTGPGCCKVTGASVLLRSGKTWPS